MTDRYCPSCGRHGVFDNAMNDPRMFICPCGMTWYAVTSDDHVGIKSSPRAEICEAIGSAIVAYHVKDEEINRQRDAQRLKAIRWYADELCKGPIVGGTPANIPYEIDNYRSDAWEALRKAVMIRDPVCRVCGKRPTQEVHHIRPRYLKGKDHPRNLIGLCLVCHDEVHRQIDAGIQTVLEESLDIKPLKQATALDEFLGVNE